MKRADRISGTFWFLFSVLTSIESYRLGLGSLHEPGPGFLCFWTGIAMAVLSLAVLARAWTAGETGEPRGSIFGRTNLLKIASVILALFLYAFFVETVGFIPMTLLLFIFLLRFIERKPWALTLAVSIAVTGMSYLVFEIWLQSQLPKGLLELLRF